MYRFSPLKNLRGFPKDNVEVLYQKKDKNS